MSAVNIAEEMSAAVPERAEEATTHATRPFLWSIRRELWENPSILVAPAAVASFVVLATLFAAVRFGGPTVVQFGHSRAPLSRFGGIPLPTVTILTLIPVPLLLGVTMVLVAIFYSLDALLSERRDRTILFWKSLPVSDSLTVFSKMVVPMIVLPVVTFILAIATQIIIFVIECVTLLAQHASVSVAWTGIPVLPLLGLMVYTLVVVTLWYAPIYAWLLLVSAWTRRAALLWAVIPFFVFAIFERIAYHTHYVRDFIHNRFLGVFSAAFISGDMTYTHNHELTAYSTNQPLGTLWTPGHFLATPALWLGLLFAALALLLVIRLRRSSGPI